MTSKNISANISIGGTVSSSLGKSFGAVRKSLQGISEELKNLKDQQKVLEQQAAAAKKAGKATGEYEKKLKDLAATQAKLEKKQGGLKSVSKMFTKPGEVKFGAVTSGILGKLATSKTFGGMTTSALGMIAEYGPMLASVAGLAMAASAALLAVAGGVFMIGKSAAETIDKTADMADGLGVTTEALQRLRHVAALSGIDADTLDAKLGKMTVSLESAKDGTGPVATALQELGLSYQELSAMKPDEQFIALSSAMKKYNGNMPKMAIGQALFGKGSAKFVNMMNQGGDAIRENAKSAHIFTKEQILQADAFDKAWNKSTNAFEGVWTDLGATFLPVITTALNEFTKMMGDPKIKEDLMVLGEIMANVFTIVWSTAKAAIWAIDKLIQPIKWIMNASKWVGETIGNVLFDQSGGSNNPYISKPNEAKNSITGNTPATNSKLPTSGMAPNASLPASVSSGAAIKAGASTSNNTTNNSPSQSNTIIINGATNPKMIAEEVQNAIMDGQFRLNATATA